MSDYIARPDHGLAWVTGASSGIGRALALRLVRDGYAVVATARDHDKLVALQHEAQGQTRGTASGRIIVLDGDVTDPRDMERILSAIEYDHGQLCLVVLNAGVYLPVHGEDLQRDDFEKTFAVNLHGVVNCLLPAIRHMKANGKGGQVALVSSVTGYAGLPTSAAYGATKAALINMAESLKFDLDKIGIRIQIINPGFVETPATAQNAFAMPALISPAEAADRIADGLTSKAFEITFPKRFTYALKLLRLLPYPAYFWLINRATGWKKRPLQTHGPGVDKSDKGQSED
ncbi:SDR family NAD(P)-dependent oxidoreductase [Pararhizobium antarcticum]|uniref:Oxidoreductase n=1 Tax=Pararhizobium antarcticum TaxID=1798805 RepID=A0A657LWB0_9HYPH|nr:SDR family NAD(P)-dependent oxidoreductase [Pararhizobium antarcticum]OJF91030.1 oxidoreductase [Rhizobium sp. 58]OJF99960.1 oxidoreductase [Pararhizobium antarcticum]